MKDLSIVIPVHDPDMQTLNKLLLALTEQKGMPTDRFEVIVVENPAKTEAVKKLVESYGFHYMWRAYKGANQARNWGIACAGYENIAILDADCVPDRTWASKVVSTFGENPKVGVFGGPVRLQFDCDKPDWLVGRFRSWLSEVNWSLLPKDFNDITNVQQYIVSANMCFRRETWERAGGFPEWETSQPDGVIQVNDENLFVKFMSQLGDPGVGYVKDMLVRHIIKKDRCNMDYFRKRLYSQGFCDGQQMLVENDYSQNVDDIYYNEVQHKANGFIHFPEIHRIRESVANEERTRKYIRQYIVSQTEYFKGLTDALEKHRDEIWGASKPAVYHHVKEDDADIENLAVVSCHFNPQGYNNPRENTEKFIESHKNATIHLVELAFDEDEFEFPDAWMHIRGTRERNLMWQKEQLLNIAIDKLANSYDAIAWVDSDILFTNDDWQQQIIDCLRSKKICQAYRHAYWQGPTGSYDLKQVSCGYNYSTNRVAIVNYEHSHPGYAWAARSEWLKRVKLYPYNIVGGADSVMVPAFAGCRSFENKRVLNKSWSDSVEKWYDKCAPEVDTSFGYINQDIVHRYHGSRKNRRYLQRWHDLASWHYNPHTDVQLGDNGLLEWSVYTKMHKKGMIQMVSDYFKKRQEDD